jgi:uncharacterized protein with PIN domain
VTPDPPPRRLLIDRMLVRLGRYLRAAGHDAEDDAHDATDRRLVERAAAERRLLLTCDRRMLQFRDADRLLMVLAANGLVATAAELSARLEIDWLKAPFTRCLVCNRPVTPVATARIATLSIPADAGPPITECAGCGRVYWQGGHARRMRARLAAWNAGRFV